MSSSPVHNIPHSPENTLDPGAGSNVILRDLDSLLQLSVVAIQNTPPGSSTSGDQYIVGTAGTGAWAGQEAKVATSVNDGAAWRFQDAFLAVVQGSPNPGLYLKLSGVWTNVTATGEGYGLGYGQSYGGDPS